MLSLPAKIDEICLLVNECNPDSYCVTETWLTPSVCHQHIAIPSTSVHTHGKGRGAGVC